MLGLNSGVDIYIVCGVTDMRKSYDGLTAIVDQELCLEALSGALFVFCNRRRDRLKILHWDGSGLCVFAKRLEQGTFSWPQSTDTFVEYDEIKLRCLLQGVDLGRTRRRMWLRKSHRQDDLSRRRA